MLTFDNGAGEAGEAGDVFSHTRISGISMQLRFSKCPMASCGLLQVSCGSPAAVDVMLQCGALPTNYPDLIESCGVLRQVGVFCGMRIAECLISITYILRKF